MMFQITCRRLKLSLKEVIKVQRPNANLLLILILTIWSMFWVSRFYIYDYTVKNIYLSTLGSVDKIEFDNHMGKILYADSLGLNLFELFVKYYGGKTLIICLSFISWIYYMKRREGNLQNCMLQGYYIIQALTIACVAFFLLFKLPFGALRLLYFVVLIGAIIVAHFLHLHNRVK